MRIIIPTYRRTGIQHTFNTLPPKWQAATTFVCDQEDADKLALRYTDTSCSFLVTEPGIDTIAKKRALILRYYAETGVDKIVMMDDDLRFAVRITNDTKLLPAARTQIDLYLVMLKQQLDKTMHAGWSARQGNNRKPAGWDGPARMMYVLGYRPADVVQHCELGRIETREDFDYTLQLLRKGFPNAVNNDICADQGYNAPGGCSLSRTVESSNADAHRLAELHPGLVKATQKDYEGSVPRVEVVVQWKKALEEGFANGETF